MTEEGFAEMLRAEGYIGEHHYQLTWEQVEEECALIDAKRSNFSANARSVFKVLQAMKKNKIRLPGYIEKRPSDASDSAELVEKPLPDQPDLPVLVEEAVVVQE